MKRYQSLNYSRSNDNIITPELLGVITSRINKDRQQDEILDYVIESEKTDKNHDN